MQPVANADSLTGGIKAAIAELGDEKGHAPLGDVVDIVRSNRPATAEEVHDVLESLQTRGELYPVGSKIAVTESDAVVTDGGHDVTEDELRNRAAQARAARAEAVLGQGDLAMAERCHKDAIAYRQRADKMGRQVLVADGGETLPTPSEWPYEAVTHGADVVSTCRAITGDGNPCTNNAYRERPLCGLHENADDPDVLEQYHQWARIEDGDDIVAVCIHCETVWDGGAPPIAVDCPTCPAEPGQRCQNEDSVYQENVSGSTGAPIPPHPERRDRATEKLVNFELCPEAPGASDQKKALTDGGAVQGDEEDETPDIMDAVDDVLEELSTVDDPWTTRDGVRAKVRERGFEREMAMRVADQLEDNDSAFCWFGFIVRRDSDVLKATIEKESEKDIPRTILIGRLNRARRELAASEAANTEGEPA